LRVVVYVEGPSDQKALEALLKPIIDRGRSNGKGISFSPQGGKGPILNKVPARAADILKQSPDDWVFALPDLYPMASYDRTENRHRSFPELVTLLQGRFISRADKINLSPEARRHFRVHCLKHDLEALLLAAPDELRRRLKTNDSLRGHFRTPVEDQNDDNPPKYVVDALFRKYRRKPDKYIDTVDAVPILARASLPAIEAACPQRFAPFVRELRALSEGGDPDGRQAEDDR
jgi:Domain of unknown function (DUF4276)